MKLQNIQALRAIAALAVVGAHVGDPDGFEMRWLAGGRHWTEPLYRPGQAGVDLFFVISGLIMTVTTARLITGPAAGRAFLLRRLTRIYPVYWVATLPVLLVFLIQPSMVNSSQPHRPRILESLLLLPQPGLPLLLVGWTLTFELYFYLIFALTLLAPHRFRLPILAVWGLLTAALAGIIGDTDQPWLALISAPICLEFLFGAILGYLILKRTFLAPKVFLTIGIIGTGVAIWLGGDDFPGTWYRAVPVGALIALIVYGVVGLEARGRVVAPIWLQGIGNASYSMYLWHVLILTALGRVILIHLPGNPLIHAVALVFSFAAVVIGSLVAYRLFEEPLMRFLHDRMPQPPKRERKTAPDAGNEVINR